MTKLLTGAQIKAIVTPQRSIDVAYFDNNTEWAQEYDLKPVLTEALFDDFLALYAVDPLFPTNPTYKTMYDKYIQYVVAYGCAFYSLKKDIRTKTDNQGQMQNSTAHSSSAASVEAKGVLMQYKERNYYYLECLATFLFNNQSNTDLALFVEEDAVLCPEFRDFLPQ